MWTIVFVICVIVVLFIILTGSDDDFNPEDYGI